MFWDDGCSANSEGCYRCTFGVDVSWWCWIRSFGLSLSRHFCRARLDFFASESQGRHFFARTSLPSILPAQLHHYKTSTTTSTLCAHTITTFVAQTVDIKSQSDIFTILLRKEPNPQTWPNHACASAKKANNSPTPSVQLPFSSLSTTPLTTPTVAGLLEAFGDTTPLPHTLTTLDEIITDFIIETCHSAALCASYSRRQKIKVDDFKWVLRRDAKKLGRVTEIFFAEKILKDNRKAFDIGTGEGLVQGKKGLKEVGIEEEDGAEGGRKKKKRKTEA